MTVTDLLGKIVSSPVSSEHSGAQAELDIDTALSLLSNERRRLTLRFAIEEADGEFDLVDVVRDIATYEYGPEYTSSERKRVYISLYQTHLSELVDAGVLERVDGDSAHTFRISESARPLYDVLEATTARLGGEK